MAYVKSLKNQQWLLPPSIDELIPEDHICLLVESLAESMDYASFDEKYSGPGHPAYHPRIFLKLLIMGILDKIRSSRKLARCSRENVVYMYLAEKLSPDFRTISDFRKDNAELIKKVFRQTIYLAKKLGMVNLTCLSTDGTKMKASASNRRTLTREELGVLFEFVDGELRAWAQQDIVEDKQFDNLRGSDQLPATSKKKIRSLAKHYIEMTKEKGEKTVVKIKQKLKTAEEEIVKNNLAKVSTTDPESRFMPNKKKRIEYSYNAQITTDQEGFVVACEAVQDEADTNQLIPQVEQTEHNLSGIPRETKWNADNGYFSTKNIEYMVAKGVDFYVPPQKKKLGPFAFSNFKYCHDADEFICPNGNAVRFLSRRFDKTKDIEHIFYKAEGCISCPNQKACTHNKKGIRILKVTPNLEIREEMERKMATETAKETYKLRRQTVEPTFGDLKKHLGLEEFVLKSLKKVDIELNLACAARNLKRVWGKQKRNKARAHLQTNFNVAPYYMAS